MNQTPEKTETKDEFVQDKVEKLLAAGFPSVWTPVFEQAIQLAWTAGQLEGMKEIRDLYLSKITTPKK